MSETTALTRLPSDPFSERTLRILVSNGIRETLSFDGLEFVKATIGEWYGDKLSEGIAKKLDYEALHAHDEAVETPPTTRPASVPAEPETPIALPSGIKLVEAEPIIDRKSVFVGRACKLTDPSDVPKIVNYLLSDKRIAKAAHPVIHAWRFEVNGIVHQDNDDDGETAAGGRLAHLIQILGLSNVLVVVTRYWGGTLLGPDRFKHINTAARNAIEAAGLLDDSHSNHKGGKRK